MSLEPAQIEDAEATGDVPERTCAVSRAKLEPSELIRFVRAPDGTVTPDLANKLPGRGVWVTLERAIVEKAIRQNAFARGLKQPVQVPEDLAGLIERLLRQRCVAGLAIANKAGLVVAGFAKVDAAIGKGRIAALIHASEAAVDGSAKLDRRLIAVYRDSVASKSRVVEAKAALAADNGIGEIGSSEIGSKDSVHAEAEDGVAPVGATETAADVSPSIAEQAVPALPIDIFSAEQLDEAAPVAETSDQSQEAAPALRPEGPVIVGDLATDELSLALGRENVVHAALSKGGAAKYFLNEVERLRRYRSNPQVAEGRPPRTRSNTEQV